MKFDVLFRLLLSTAALNSISAFIVAPFVHHHGAGGRARMDPMMSMMTRKSSSTTSHLGSSTGRTVRSHSRMVATSTTDGETQQRKSSSTPSTPIVTRLPDSAVELQIPVSGTETKAEYDKVCKELSKKVQIPGFRKGTRIPPAVLEQNMSAKGGRNALKVQAIKQLLERLVEPTLKEQALDPIGQAVLRTPAEDLAENYKPGEPITLPVRCDVWPEIQWKSNFDGTKPYVGLTGRYQRRPFNQDKLDKALADLTERYATLQPIEDDEQYELQMGDACTVNMEGYLALADGVTKGDPLPNAASGDNVEVVLGAGRYMEGLVEGLVGAKVGETRTVSVSFPDKLRDKSLAGKLAIFDVQVLEASKRSVPDVTDEFASKVRAGLTKDGLMKELIKAIDAEDSKEFAPARNKALSEALAGVMDVEVPDTLVTNQAREKFATMLAEMRNNGVSDDEIKKQISPENFNKYKDIVKDDIVKDFKVSMATDEIARLEGISVPEYQVDEQMEAIRKDADKSEEFDEKMIRAKVQTTLDRQAVMDWLAEQSSLEVQYVDEKGAQFDEELMQKLAEESLERERKMAGETGDAVAVAESPDGKIAAQEGATVVASVDASKGTTKGSVVEEEEIGAEEDDGDEGEEEIEESKTEEVLVEEKIDTVALEEGTEAVEVQETETTEAAASVEAEDKAETEEQIDESKMEGEKLVEEAVAVQEAEATEAVSVEEEDKEATTDAAEEAVAAEAVEEEVAEAVEELAVTVEEEEDEEAKAGRYASMSLEERAFNILRDLDK